MRRARRTLVALAILFGSAVAASADPIVILTNGLGPAETSRFTRVTGFIPGSAVAGVFSFDQNRDALTSTAPLAAGGSSEVGTATLTSSFADPLHLFGSATSSLSWTAPANVAATASFRAGFQVTSPVTYAFNSSLTASSSSIPDHALAFQEARSFALLGQVLGPGGDEDRAPAVLLFDFSTPVTSGAVNSALNPSSGGLLMPGEYFLFAIADSTASIPFPVQPAGAASANFAFTLDFTPASASPSATPEPASLLLLGTGIAGVFGCGRRRRVHAERR